MRAGETFDFSFALAAVKGGERIERRGWNGRGMFVFLHPSTQHRALHWRERAAPMWGPGDKCEQEYYRVSVGPFLCMKAADGTFVPWLASQTDLLADDWMLTT